MTLITAIIVGLPCGYFLGLRRRAFGVWLSVWAVVLVVQTLFVVAQDDVNDWLYWPVQAAILFIAMGMVWLGAKLRSRRTGSA